MHLLLCICCSSSETCAIFSCLTLCMSRCAATFYSSVFLFSLFKHQRGSSHCVAKASNTFCFLALPSRWHLAHIKLPANVRGKRVSLLLNRSLRGLSDAIDMYSFLQELMDRVGDKLPAALRAHLEACQTPLSMFLPAWLLTAFAGDFPLCFAARVLDIMLAQVRCLQALQVLQYSLL